MAFDRKFKSTLITQGSERNSKFYWGLLKEKTVRKRAKQNGMTGVISVRWNDKGDRTVKEIQV